jgi:hypothetical protein
MFIMVAITASAYLFHDIIYCYFKGNGTEDGFKSHNCYFYGSTHEKDNFPGSGKVPNLI